ncbi:MAG TPA: hypothetical protein DCX54_09620 [Flavobacteriales bacterium]|nr:hypothetical protein [Flavobacteriales bacterium]
MKTRITLAITTIGLSLHLMGQNVVTRNDTVSVVHGSDTLKLAWASGINVAHISEIDLNLDGKMDLFIFEPNNELNDETGDKILPFINTGGSGIGYRYAPEYRAEFVNKGVILEGMTMLRDYNCDGKMDIFTHDIRDRVTVYKNTSTTSLTFKLVTKALKTDTSALPPNFFHSGEIYWNWEDMISITDIDSDGDLDILTIDYSGSFVEYHKNMSMEKYGNCDSLVFELKNTCWGYFAEDFGTITLDTCNPYGNVTNPEIKGKGSSGGSSKGAKHSNTSLMAIDLDGDGDKDLISGDGLRNFLYAYINGGDKDSSKITSYVLKYPAAKPADMIVYGIPSYVDVNHDNKKDLIVSPRYDLYKDYNSVWLYKNTGSTSNPAFAFETESFLQGEMIDVGYKSKPVFFDYNQDSLLDLVVGNYGYFKNFAVQYNDYSSQLALYENVGSLQAPAFKLVDLDFAGLSTINLNVAKNKPSYGLHPTFGDLDGDGDEDLILGDYRGKLHYFTNNPVNGKANFTLDTPEFLSIAGVESTPQLFDLDDDGKLDLLVGESEGSFNYFRNESNGSLKFTLLDDSLGNINVREWWDWTGNSVPYFYRDDSLNTVRMLAGTKLGRIQLYDSIVVGDTLRQKFHLVEYSYQNMYDGIYSSISGGDLNNDGSLDFVLGNRSGGVTLFTSEDSIYIPGISEQKFTNLSSKLYPNPAGDEITIVIDGADGETLDYHIFNSMGQGMSLTRGSSNHRINVSSLKNGIYFVRIENKNRSISITERFVKVN